MPRGVRADPPEDVVAIVEELVHRKSEIDTRLEELGVTNTTSGSEVAPLILSAAKASAVATKRGRRNAAKIIAAEASANHDDSANDNNNNNNDTDANANPNAASSASANSSSNLIPYTPKTDTHWDFVMKEMMWLGADFQGERKRQTSLAKKLASSVKQFHKTKEARRLRELHQAEMKRRKLAAKIGRDVKGWWTKIEKVISYKQKLLADEERQAAMNKQLVVLVQQTEKYTESLTQNAISEEDDDEDEDDESDSDQDGTETGDNEVEESTTDDNMATSDSEAVTSGSEDGRRRERRQRKRRKQRRRLTIEEALAAEPSLRKSKKRIIDYSRMRLPSNEKFYGESTASDASGSDGSYHPEDDGEDSDNSHSGDDDDDDSTFQQAMHEELKERNQDETSTFLADPEELRKLREEVSMDVDDILERLRQEGEEEQATAALRMEVEESSSRPNTPTMENKLVDAAKRVHFSETIQEKAMTPEEKGNTNTKNDTPPATAEAVSASTLSHDTRPSTSEHVVKYDADDDGDASDVEDYYDDATTDQKSDEEFEQKAEPEVDDETTISQEESLPREMSTSEELALLQKEGELSIDELRKMYTNLDQGEAGADKPEENDSTTPSETKDEEGKEQKAVGFGNADENETEEDQEEFEPPSVAEVDDETTLDAEEKLGRDMTHEEEMAMLQQESEIPIEQLRAMYAKAAAELGSGDEGSDDDEDDPMEIDEESSSSSEAESSTPRISAATALAGSLHAEEIGSEGEGAEEFELSESEAVDDETTMEVEERLGRDMSYEDEIALLKRESEMSVEELRAKYAAMESSPQGKGDERDDDDSTPQKDNNSSSLTSELFGHETDNGEDEEEFAPSEVEAVDDETTIEAEERLGREMSHEEEIDLLKRESEMSVEELRELYAGMNDNKDNSDPEEDEDMEEVDDDDQKVSSAESGKRKRDSDDNNEEPQKSNEEEDEGGTSEDGLAALNALEASAERAQQTLASRPFLLASWVKLRQYQQVGLNWLVSLQSRRLNGILADEMGLGKTLQTISLLGYLASYKGIWGPHLIVVPTSVIINWETELKRFCPALKVLCYYGSAKRRKELRQGWTKTNWYHVVITSYQLAVQDAFAFKRKKWYYLVLDEAQNIKNFQSQRWQTLINFNTQRRLLLTGTPLQNNLMELWSLLHFLMPYIFRSRKEFSYWFSNPMHDMIEGNASRNEDVIKRLHGIIRPFVLRRLKKDVETQMPGKYEHTVKCQLSRRQMTLYEEFLSRSSTRVALKKGGNFMGMMNVLMQLRKVCNHPDLFEPRSVVTPFVLPSLSITVPSFVCSTSPASLTMEGVSLELVQPIWCGSCGLPSIDGALRHNNVESEELKRLSTTIPLSSMASDEAIQKEECPDELKVLVAQVYKFRRDKAEANVQFRNRINLKRCHAPSFPYSDSLLSSLEVEHSVFQRSESVELNKNRNIILTPEAVLNMRRNEQERAEDLEEIIDKYVFCVPPAGARAPVLDAGNRSSDVSLATKNLDEMLLEPVEEFVRPFRKAQARLSSFFPDKKLIQFDAGKLQALAELLRTLKRGGHRCLIFTQMSKMLDLLEAFLNLNGHTYLRLDGATGIDRRQRYMDRFNNDTKIFCFILSTRSGGMGINLTGADTVIFYDSDWNPAMDAQAQDRAHRIGQTRDVHIYRLITEHTIEENILLKAKQKKNLDIMVMDQGKFDASHQLKSAAAAAEEDSSGGDQMKDVFTKGGLRAILGVDDSGTTASTEDNKAIENSEDVGKEDSGMSSEQMEIAMASLEDEDDVQALRGAQKEAAEEMQEFDENAEISKNSDGEDEDEDEEENKSKSRPKKKQKKVKEDQKAEEPTENKNEESELEKEFAAWQTTVGFDATSIEASLSPMERYALSFREKIDPFYSIFYINELRRKSEAAEPQEEIDIEEIEREKAMEERRAMDDGDLLGTRPRPDRLIRQRNLYRREKARLRSEKKRRKITGENWVPKVDGQTKNPFWYNEDTGEAIWDTPAVLIELQAEELASKKGWGSLQIKLLANIMEYLLPYPERQCCSLVCKQWKSAANDFRFVRHVYPVEMGALGRDPSRRDHNHFGSIEEALSAALAGDTIELSDGHYWVTGAGLIFDKPLRLIGDEHNAANVVVEMSGSIHWTGKGGFIEGATFRRPKMTSSDLPDFPMLKIEGEGRVDIVHSVLDNDGSTGSVVVASGVGRKGDWKNVSLRNGGGNHGIQLLSGGEGLSLNLSDCIVRRVKIESRLLRDSMTC